jgi:hypothetical protein
MLPPTLRFHVALQLTTLAAHGVRGAPLSSDYSDCYTHGGICLPSWEPTWDMYRSTLLYTCNNSGLHDVNDAVKFGTVVYDWSNAKEVWANRHPMNSEELITKQAEAVLARDPGIPGQAPRVWAYRNTIKALNWYSSVREKLDDPRYASWFIKFKGFSNSPYPGGRSKDVEDLNASFAAGAAGAVHVPPCDWYDNGTAPRCSGFYHDQVRRCSLMATACLHLACSLRPLCIVSCPFLHCSATPPARVSHRTTLARTQLVVRIA